ncbi:hypothetical protein F2Q69_00061871 [Brassica cretica]|uniref:Uncharacterized protein n=1 Tax=Brassica cretica TaxID=69181 RepID=A0A8S9RDR7_BRACR|nr:hypothetical protein F2Q69_00061871 [Brassica cretica]
MMLSVSQAPSICTDGASSSHHKKFENSLSTEEEDLVPTMAALKTAARADLTRRDPLEDELAAVDIAYIPFIERFHLIFKDVMNVDITAGRPNLAYWLKEMNTMEHYTETRQDPQEIIERYKKRAQAEARRERLASFLQEEVDIAYIPFIERFHLIFKDVMNVDITAGRPNLAYWLKEMNTMEHYTETRQDPQEIIERYKKRAQAEARP